MEKIIINVESNEWINKLISTCHQIKFNKGIKFEAEFESYNENNEEIAAVFKQNNEILPKNIGLFISKEIIKSHFVKIIFENNKDNFTLIGFWLPNK